ncbi:MAG: 2-dehydropantoate 2-reductase [Bacillota bacterium]
MFCCGSGAIGSLVGGRLFRTGMPVALIGRGPHLEAVRNSGLILEDGFDPGPLHAPAFTSVSEAVRELGAPEAVILAVKAYDVEGAVDELAQDLPAGTEPVVLCLQNGLGSEERAAARFPPERVLAGAITLSVERPGPGRVRLLTDRGGLTVAPLGPEAAGGRKTQEGRGLGPGPHGRAQAALVESLRAAGFGVRVYPRADSVKWSKVLLNLWANATCAIFDLSPREVVADPLLFRLDWLAFREALRVMERAGIPAVDLPGYPVRLLAALGRLLPEPLFRRLLGGRVVGGRGGKMPSFWIDLQAGRDRSEVSFLNGAVVRCAGRLGLDAPANKALAEALEAVAAGFLPRTHFAGRAESFSGLTGRGVHPQ